MPLFLVVLSLFLGVLQFEARAEASAPAETGTWKVTRIYPVNASEPTLDEARDWLDQTLVITANKLEKGEQSCPIAPQARDIVPARYFRDQYGVDPATLNAAIPLARHVATGCPLPGLDPLILLDSNQALLSLNGAFLRLARQAETTPPAPVAPAPLAPITEWRYFSVPEAGITLRYPPRVTLVAPHQHDQPGLTLSLQANQIDQLEATEDAPFPFSQTVATQDQQALEEGLFGAVPDFPVRGSEAVMPLTEVLHAKSYAVFSQLDFCNVSFQRLAVLYHRGHQVVLTLSADIAAIQRQNPTFFTRDAAQCGDALIWNYQEYPDAPERFYHQIKNRQRQGLAADWFRAFEAMLSQLIIQPAPVAEKPTPKAVSCPRLRPSDPEWSPYRTLPKHSFPLDLPGYGRVCFLALARDHHGDRFILTNRAGDPLFVFPDDRPAHTQAVGFPDLNRDGIPEVILIARTALGKQANRAYWSHPGQETTIWRMDARINHHLDDFRGFGTVKRYLLKHLGEF